MVASGSNFGPQRSAGFSPRMARPDLDDLPFCIRRGLEARRSATGAAEDSTAAAAPSASTSTEAASSAAAHLAELFPAAVSHTGGSLPFNFAQPSQSRQRRQSSTSSKSTQCSRQRRHTWSSTWTSSAAAGLLRSSMMLRVFSEDDGHLEPPERSPHSSDSSEIVRREDLRRREGTPRWALGSRAERREALDRDFTSRREEDRALGCYRNGTCCYCRGGRGRGL